MTATMLRASSGSARSTMSLLALFLVLLSSASCIINPQSGQPQLTESGAQLVGVLVGAAAEGGAFVLSKSVFVASVAGGASQVGTTYLLDSLELVCHQCDSTSRKKDISVDVGKPSLVHCATPGCDDAAYLVVFRSAADRDAQLDQIKRSLPVSCLLSSETLADGGTRLTWLSENATAATLNGRKVPANGALDVTPDQAGAYTLKVIGKGGSAQDRVNVTSSAVARAPESEPTVVTAPPPPVASQPSAPARRAQAVVPSGQILECALDYSLESNQATPGSQFTMHLTRPVYGDSGIVLPAGALLYGTVRESFANDSGARMTLGFDGVDVGGRTYRLSAVPVSRDAHVSKKSRVGRILVGVGIGVVAGGAAGGRRGAAAGGAAGGGAAYATQPDAKVEFRAGEAVPVRLLEPIELD